MSQFMNVVADNLITRLSKVFWNKEICNAKYGFYGT